MRLLKIRDTGCLETEKFMCSDGEVLEFKDSFLITRIRGRPYLVDWKLNYK